MKQQILDSYQGDECYEEVRDLLNRWHPRPDKMNPVFGVSDLEKGTGLVCSSRVAETIVKSELASKKAMIEILEEDFVGVLEDLSVMKRDSKQLARLESLLGKIGPLVKDFSSSPDLVQRLDEAAKAIAILPMDAESVKSETGKATIQATLDLFSTEVPAEELEAEPDEPEVYDGVGGYKHQPDEPEKEEQAEEEQAEEETEDTLEW